MGIKEKIKSINFTKKKVIISGVIVALLFGGVMVVKNKSNGAEMGNNEPIPPETYMIPGREKIFINGKVLPVQSKDLSVDPEKGELNQIKVQDGQWVEKGALLFTCKNQTSITELASLKTEVSKKQSEKNQVVDEEVKKAIDSEISELNKQISTLEKTAYSSVYAPFSGKIYINNQESSLDQPASLMTLETSEFYIKGQASEQDLSKISIDQEVDILVFSTKEELKGKITHIGERPSQDGGSDMMAAQNMSYYDIKISFNEGQDLNSIKNGFHVQTTIKSATSDIKIPNTAIIEEEGKSYVFEVKDGIMIKTEIVKGDSTEEYTVITDGIEEEEEIIRYVDDSIVDGGSLYPEDAANEGEVNTIE